MTMKYLLPALVALVMIPHAEAANRPAGYVTICSEGKTCSVATNTSVAYGRSNQFTYKTLSGSFVCGEVTFGTGSKVSGGVNECSAPSGTSSSSSSSTASSSSSSTSSSSSSTSSASSSTSSSSSSATGACAAGSVFTNTTVDCGGITVGTSCDGGSESQQPIFTLNNATIRNVRINANAADGIHCASGNCRAENVVWEDVCEDAATNKSEGGTFTISGGSATAAQDKTFQHNSKNSTFIIENFNTYGAVGKLWRSCGDCSNNGGPRYVQINNVTINGTISSTVVGLNRNYGDKATIRNLKVKGLVWTSAITSKPRICEEWKGIVKGSGSTEKYGEYFNTAYCDVSPADVTSF